MNSARYKAFISYSHGDEKWARWLQHSLERYRVPGRLVGSDGYFGPIPARLHPVFRDREDLSSASDLSAQIKNELAHAETLVVICSPAAAASQWVNEEIRYFRHLGRADRIFSLIVDGDPRAREPELRCFPPALLESVGDGDREPLAADLRKYADGKHLARLKIIAGILGIRLDELRRRESQRRLRQRFTYSSLALILVAMFGWLIHQEATTRATAAAQQANMEELLGFMLGDLERLDPIQGLERISPDDEAQAALRARFGLERMSDDELLERALAWRDAGIEFKWRGELAAAMEQFVNSRAAIIELFQREGNTQRALFELGQAEFYVGEVQITMGEIDRAQRSWSHYGALTRRLVNAEPTNPKYVMELSYTLLNLGALELSRQSPEIAKSLRLLQVAVQYNQMALVFDPDNPEYHESLMNELAWLSDALLETCALGSAFEVRRQNVSLRRESLEANSDDGYAQRELAYSLTGLAGIQRQIGLNAQSVSSFEEAVALLQRLHESDPANEDIEWQALYRRARLARLLLDLGKVDESSAIIDPMEARVNELADPAAHRNVERSIDALHFNLDQARLLLAHGEGERGQHLLRRATARAAELAGRKPGLRDGLRALARAKFMFWRQFGETPGDDVDRLLAGFLGATQPVNGCHDASLGAQLAVANGDIELAKRYSSYVLGKGYFDPAFVQFCREHRLCSPD